MIKIISAQCICLACPSTFTGKTADGETIYARYRWGRLSVRIDESSDPEFGGAAGFEILEKAIGHEFNGWLSYSELRHHTAGLLEWPDELTAPDPTDSTDTLTL